MPSITIYMREEIFKLMEALCIKESLSRGKIIEEAVLKYATERGIQTEREKVRARVRE